MSLTLRTETLVEVAILLKKSKRTGREQKRKLKKGLGKGQKWGRYQSTGKRK